MTTSNAVRVAYPVGRIAPARPTAGREDPTTADEAQANAFAGEFLMSAEVIRPALRSLKIGRLRDHCAGADQQVRRGHPAVLTAGGERPLHRECPLVDGTEEIEAEDT